MSINSNYWFFGFNQMAKILKPRSFIYDRFGKYITNKTLLDNFIKIIPNDRSNSVFLNHVIQPVTNLLKTSLFINIMNVIQFIPSEITRVICLIFININLPYIIYKSRTKDNNNNISFYDLFKISDYLILNNRHHNIYKIDETYRTILLKKKIHIFSKINVFYNNNKNFMFKNNNVNMLTELDISDRFYLIHQKVDYYFE